ncbi:MAG TPA: hypothetical protein VJ761_11280, partial [Ktedonobacteraceae bacterium]|nr:hypothetical protein [Ktedonobacteraceae bacterium]
MTKPKPHKQRSALDIRQVLDELDAVLESSHLLGKGQPRGSAQATARRGEKLEESTLSSVAEDRTAALDSLTRK